MGSEVTLGYTISKAAYKLIKAGKAVLSSGGVRTEAGTFIELAKPAVSNLIPNISNTLSLSSLNPKLAVVNLVSSLASNVQSGFIQHGVNIANVKLDSIITQLTNLTKAATVLNQINILSWVNTAFSLANCGISIAGLHMTLKRLDGVSSQIQEMFNRYQRDRESDKLETYERILLDLKADLAYIQQLYKEDDVDQQLFLYHASFINEHLNEARAFLQTIMNDFQARTIDGKLGCEIIFTLLSIYSELLNEYCCWYYYIKKTHHPLYHDWFGLLSTAESPSLQAAVKSFLLLEPSYAAIAPQAKANAYQLLFEGVKEQKATLTACAESIEKISFGEYRKLEHTVYGQIDEIVNDYLPEGTDLDTLLQKNVNDNAYELPYDQYFIPVTTFQTMS